ncbi:reverse transcriptase [Gossypium australe]|uniref:Reverse transcriptase n=1 Tax=Gossypium australe TaxID=47621 RepID=A0A5B6X1K8_9ROSI|nr:reverse transcriptase [Gossypium australe]
MALVEEFRVEEVTTVVKNIKPLKASSMDGYPALFYKKYWHIMGDEISRHCLDILDRKKEFGDINNTTIVLIPKVNSPNCMTQLRPISLCNVEYKIISKAVVNRFRTILDICIDEAQVTFVPRRQITGNALIAYEVLQSLKEKKERTQGQFMLKLEMSKAYNMVEWNFIEQVMRRMGFFEEWLNLVMKCVRMVEYSVLFNGVCGEKIKPSRRLIQGDPLNDSILFGEASLEGANAIKSILNEYEGSDCKEQIGASLGENRKKEAFANFKHRFLRRIENWSIQQLSFGVSFTSHTSLYDAMFLIAYTLFHELENIISKFWWRISKTDKGVHWCEWREVCKSKVQGGLGFKDSTKFNIALLAKQGWKLIMNPNCLFARLMKAKYYLNNEFLNAILGSHPSFSWRSIWCARGLLKVDMGWRVGNGKSINLWKEAWLPGSGQGKIIGQNNNINFTIVSDLINSKQITWRSEVLRKLFDEEQANII